jgi:plasmid maintenance system antidote protein VapI
MKEHAYSVRGLAKDLDASRNTIEKWRGGKAPITRRTQLALEALSRRRQDALYDLALTLELVAEKKDVRYRELVRMVWGMRAG